MNCTPRGTVQRVKRVSIWVPLYVLLGVTASTVTASAQSVGSIYISQTELAQLPMTGPAWDALKLAADSPLEDPPNLSARNKEGVQVLAKALVYARTGQDSYRQEVLAALTQVIGTEGGDALATFRALGTYTVSADLVGLPAAQDQVFRNWLQGLLDPNNNTTGSRNLLGTHEDRPNNWGTHAGGSRAAIAAYLGDTAELARVAQVFKGWLGDRTSYADFDYGELSWQCDPNNPVGINPKGCTKDGHNIDGVIPDDQRRAGSFAWPPPLTNYAWESLQGVWLEAIILHRAGYDVFNWQDKAILRAVQWLYQEANYPAEGDDEWQPHVINYYYGTNYVETVPARTGKNLGWTDWTHQGQVGEPEDPAPAPPSNLRFQ